MPKCRAGGARDIRHCPAPGVFPSLGKGAQAKEGSVLTSRVRSVLGAIVLVVPALLVLPVGPAAASSALQIEAHDSHTCVVTAAGAVKCWGNNQFGYLGDGTTETRDIPTDVVGLGSGVVDVAVGSEHGCALTDQGVVKCWGRNTYGEVGDGTTQIRLEPVRVVGLPKGVKDISAGNGSTCVITASDTVKCWGDNEQGQLGTDAVTASPSPVLVEGVSGTPVALASGNRHSCVVLVGGGLQCWGQNGDGQLGTGDTDNRFEATDVQMADPVSTVSPGIWHTCAVTESGAPWCWGQNEDGQLGDGTTEGRLLPTAVTGGLAGVTDIAAGIQHTCAVDGAGAAWCWGNDYSGVLGSGEFEHIRPTPVPVSSMGEGVADVTVGDGHSCAVKDSGFTACWGSNSWSALGTGQAWSRLVPANVWGMTGATTEHFQPDALVATLDGPFRGRDIYNTTAEGQTFETTLAPGENVEYRARFVNDGTTTDRVFLTPWQSGGSLKYRWRYFLGDVEITDEVRYGDYRVDLDPGESVTITMRIYKRLSAPDVKRASGWYDATSSLDSRSRDVIRVRVS